MNYKKLVIITIIIILLITGFLFYSIKNPVAPAEQNEEQGTKIISNNKIQTSESTIKNLLTDGKTLKCTYSFITSNSSATGQVYVANGKLREDFQSSSTAGAFLGHLILDSQQAYLWTNQQVGQGIKFSISAKSMPQVNYMPDINKAMHFECFPWNIDNSLFEIPANINFQANS